MTADKPDFTRASRGLDAFIHTAIFGKEVQWMGDIPYRLYDTGVYRSTGPPIPSYSSDRTAAFELAWTFQQCHIFLDAEADTARVRLGQWFQFGGKDGNAEGRREDFPLLVCQAALRAKGIL